MNRFVWSLLIWGAATFVINSHVEGFLVTRQVEDWDESCDRYLKGTLFKFN